MLTVRVMEDRVIIKLNRKDGLPTLEKPCSRNHVPEPDLLDPSVADAVTGWANGDPAISDAAPAPAPAQAASFRAEKREIALYEDRVTVCGEEVWRDCGQTHLRDALALLSRQDKHGYIRIRGTQLSRDLGRDATNHIGKPLAEFCKRVCEAMRQRGIDCSREDVIKNSAGGYHFREWISIVIIGSWAVPLGVSHATSEISPDSKSPAAPMLNERQQWVLGQVQAGVKLTLRDVVAHFRSEWNRSTLNRDLKDLRDQGLLISHPNGHYTKPS